MKWKLDKNRPICPQMCQQLCARIVDGTFAPNQRLMSVRELAMTAGVNPNTVQRAFEQLEQQGVLFSVRGAGWYVSADAGAAEAMYHTLIKEKVAAFFEELAGLGIPPEEAKKIVEEWKNE